MHELIATKSNVEFTLPRLFLVCGLFCCSVHVTMMWNAVSMDYNQYLNCKILHGGTLLQPWPNAFGKRKYFSEGYVVFAPKLGEDQKKERSSPQIWSVFHSKSIFPTISNYNRPEFVGFIHAGWLFFVWSSSAQISMGVHLNPDGGTLTQDGGTRLPYNLSTDYNQWNEKNSFQWRFSVSWNTSEWNGLQTRDLINYSSLLRYNLVFNEMHAQDRFYWRNENYLRQ